MKIIINFVDFLFANMEGQYSGTSTVIRYSQGEISYLAYYKDGKLHNEDGPAVFSNYWGNQYWLDGKKLTKQEWEEVNFHRQFSQLQIHLTKNGLEKQFSQLKV